MIDSDSDEEFIPKKSTKQSRLKSLFDDDDSDVDETVDTY